MLARTRRVAALAVLATAAAVALPGAALAAECADPPSTKAFAQWGDQNDYFPAPGGTFEGPLQWTANGASLASANEPFLLAGPGASSLRVVRGAAPNSPEFCVSEAHPYLRFVAKAGLGTTTDLKVWVRFYDDGGVLKETTVEAIPAVRHAVWAPSIVVPLNGPIGLDQGQVGQASVRFTAEQDWLVDDVLIDPYRR